MMAHVEEEEWEYEYDENETEDLYVPVDIANVPAIQGAIGVGSAAQRGHPKLLKTKLRALNAERREAGNSWAAQNLEDANQSIGKIQCMGLHTENPLMVYNGQLLSCEWNKTIGTDLIFAKPESGTGEMSRPLRSLPAVDLLASSSARLVVRVARLRPKDDVFEEISAPKDDKRSSVESVDTSVDIEPVVATTTSGEDLPTSGTDVQATSAIEAPRSSIQPASSNFLNRLNAIKAKRGEASRLGLSITPNGARLVTTKEGATPSNAEGVDTIMSGT